MVVRRLTDEVRRWQRMTLEAAQLQLRAREARTGTQRERAAALAAVLGRRLLARVECFDVSHTRGERAVASCVVWEDGMKRAAYRRYNVAPAAPGDDCAAIGEAVRRRFEGSRPDEAVLPQLLVVDGGPHQVERALRALAVVGIDLPVVGLSKGPAADRRRRVLHRGDGGGRCGCRRRTPPCCCCRRSATSARFALAGHLPGERRPGWRIRWTTSGDWAPHAARRCCTSSAAGGVRGASLEALAGCAAWGPSSPGRFWARLHDGATVPRAA
jgi:hypothetical protein